jgi:hypothetical protein
VLLRGGLPENTKVEKHGKTGWWVPSALKGVGHPWNGYAGALGGLRRLDTGGLDTVLGRQDPLVG